MSLETVTYRSAFRGGFLRACRGTVWWVFNSARHVCYNVKANTENGLSWMVIGRVLGGWNERKFTNF